MNLRVSNIQLFRGKLEDLPYAKIIVNTLNAHSYNVAQNNTDFVEALNNSDVILPDGVSIVWAKRFLDGTRLKKIAGADLFAWEMQRLNKSMGTCFFLGSSMPTLRLIQERASNEFPNVKVHIYSPPFVNEFSESENTEMIKAINSVNPDVLFIGMTAPKQEIWAYQHKEQLNCGHICCIGAVFDFYAGTVKRAPQWMIQLGLEWLYRFIKEPRRLWKRYLIGNIKFTISIVKEKFN